MSAARASGDDAPVAILWFRNDLRLDDNPALEAAVEGGYAILPVYIHAPGEGGRWRPGAASDAWRARSLQALARSLEARGVALRCFKGPSLATLQAIVAATGAQAVFWNRRYEPAIEKRDTGIKQALKRDGLRAESFNGALMAEPWTVETREGGPYRVFTPYWRTAFAQWRRPPTWTAPEALKGTGSGPRGVAVESLGLAPSLDWDAGFWNAWAPGEAGAREALQVFADGALRGYGDGRDRPDQVGTSRLSPHLHFGEIAPWRIVESLEAERNAALGGDIDAYVRELGWREFAHHLLHHFPKSVDEDFSPKFAGFQWADPSSRELDRVRAGRTGVPIVDAGLRELWHTGWMHNRVRMIVGSYLTKHLRWHWRHGAEWFWDTLVDADLANNTLGWQWVAGTGADAAPYFRVFNPVTQAKRFDPDGRYIARWVPELSQVPLPARFAPWEGKGRSGAHAGDYPAQPMVGIAEGRQAALDAYAALKG